MTEPLTQLALTPYRILDLTEGGANLAGKVLGDLGADVIRVEPPGGSLTRAQGPFIRHPAFGEISARWLAFNTNKRGITLDVRREPGRTLLSELARTADVILLSPVPDLEEGLELAAWLRAEAPRCNTVMVAPFGSYGPFASFQATDLVLWALSGFLYLTGDPDRPPVRISVPIAEAMAGEYAAAAAMIALWNTQQGGMGQHIDVDMRDVSIWAGMGNTGHGTMFDRALHREGQFRNVGYTRLRSTYRCKDGFIVYFTMEGRWGAPFNRRLAAWILEETGGPEHFRAFDWEHWSPASKLRRGDAAGAERDVRLVEEPFGAFFATKPKGELFERAVRDELLIAPVLTTQEIMEWRQFEETGFWSSVAGDTVGGLEYPGPFAVLSETPMTYRRVAPRLGEHNQVLFVHELGHPQADVDAWISAGVL